MANFKLAIDNSTKRVVHIDLIEEGYADGICPTCESPLIASNRNKSSRIKDTYFRHKTEEGGGCGQETLAHLWAKQIIADDFVVKLPAYSIIETAKDNNDQKHTIEKVMPAFQCDLNESIIEHRVDFGQEFRVIDIFCRDTESQEIAIEICVNHAVDDAKTRFFKRANIECIEIDISEEAISLLNSPDRFKDYVKFSAPRVWINNTRHEHQALEVRDDVSTLIENANKDIAKRLKTIKDSARSSARRYIMENRIALPSLMRELSCTINDETYTQWRNILPANSMTLDELVITRDDDVCLVLSGHKENSEGKREITIIYTYANTIPLDLKNLPGSVIHRPPPTSQKGRAASSWINNEKEKFLFRRAIFAFREESQSRHELTAPFSTCLSNIASRKQNIKEIKEPFFKKNYWQWNTWVMKTGLFTPSSEIKNPKIPGILKKHAEYQVDLWMFDEWPVYTVSKLVGFINDNHFRLSYTKIFDFLVSQSPLCSEFLEGQKMRQTQNKLVDHNSWKQLNRELDCELIIQGALLPFQQAREIKYEHDCVTRTNPAGAILKRLLT